MITDELLLIDDDPISNFINSKIIKNEYPHLIVKSYKNAALALNYIKENSKKKFQILLDINMPIMDGWQFIEAISNEVSLQQQNLKIDILTSSVDHYDREKATKYTTVNSFLVKPLNKERVKGLILCKTNILSE